MEDIAREPSSFVPDNYKHLNVLVVDNDPIFLNRITAILELFTYNVVTTTIPALGLAMAQEKEYERFQIVLANLEMQGMRRPSFLQILVKNCIPVVAIVREMRPNYFSQLREEGATFCMVKPNDWPVLKDVWQYARLKQNRPITDKEAGPSRKKHKQSAINVDPPKSKDQEVVREPGVMDKGKEIVREAEDMDNGQDDEVVGEPEGMNKGKEVVRESEVYFSVIGDNVVEWIAKPFKKNKGNKNMYDHTEYYCQINSRTPLSKKNGNPMVAESTPQSVTENITTGARTNAISDTNNIYVQQVFGQLQKCASEAKRLYEQHFANGSFISEKSSTQLVDNVRVSPTKGSNSKSSKKATRFAIRGPAISPASYATENCTSSLQWASAGSNSSSSLSGAVGFDNATTRYVQGAATNLQGAFTTSSSQGQNAMQAANYSYLQAQVAGPTLLGQEFGVSRSFLGNTSDLSQFNLPTIPQGANSQPQVASQNQVPYSQVAAETSLRGLNDDNAIISNIERRTQQPIESEDNLPSDFFENLETYFTTSDYWIDNCNQIDANLSTPLINGSLGLTNLLGEVDQDFADLMD